MSKRDRAKPAKGRRERTELLEAVRREHARADRRDKTLIWTGGIIGVALVVGFTGFAVVSQRAGESLADVQNYPSLKASHVTGPVTYKEDPPAGGPHAPVWLNCGQYQQVVPKENAVHSLEHGAVWVTYPPDAPADTVSALEAKVTQPYTLLSPYEDLKSPVVASAWGKQIFLDGADDPRLDAFLREYVQGTQAPETGAACEGGTDGSDPNAGGSMAP